MTKHNIYDQNGKKIRVRMCVACRQSKPKSLLVRVYKTLDGRVFVDKNTTSQGRGAYICNNKACIEKSQKLALLQRSLKTNVPKEIYEVLLDIE